MRSCFGFGCARTRSSKPSSPTRTSPRIVVATAAQQQAARTIQRMWRGASTRKALRTGTMRRTVRAKRTASLPGLASLPANMKRKVLNRAIPRLPGFFNKKQAPKRQLSANMQQWLRMAHQGNQNFPNTPSYDRYVNQVWNFAHNRNADPRARRAKLTKGILARYELLKPVPGYASTDSPRVIAWRRRLEANFNRKYTRRSSARLSSRELYAFLQTMPLEYLIRTGRNAPHYA